jgi:hypothetical protein
MKWKDIDCRSDSVQGGGLILGPKPLIGYREGRCERTGPEMDAPGLAYFDLVTWHDFHVATESPKRRL